MDNDNGTSAEQAPNNPEYTKYWVEFLQKKNATLNIVWPVLLTLSVFFLVATLYFYQGEQASIKRTEEAKIQVDKLQVLEIELSSNVQNLKQQNNSLAQEIELLQAIKQNLEQQKGDSNTRLTLTNKMTETLKETISAMESEKKEMIETLAEARKLLLKQKNENSQKLSTLEARHKKSKSISTKEIANRKSAYVALVKRQREMQDEIDRLASVVNSQDLKIASVTKENSQLKAKAQLTKGKKQAEQVLTVDTKPLQPTSPIPTSKSADTSEASLNDGLDEIRRPEKTIKETINPAQGKE